MKKGQTAVEFLLIFAAVLLLVFIATSVNREQISTINTQKINTQAQSAVEEIAAASQQVYAQGEGAKKRIFIIVPEGYDPESSSLSNRTIKMRVRETDYTYATDFDIYGSVPRYYGGQWLWVISEGTSVRISDALFRVVPVSINNIMSQNATDQETFTVESLSNTPINVTLDPVWSNSVSLDLSTNSFSLNASETQVVTVTFESPVNAIGFQSGSIFAQATNGTTNDSLSLPITIEVVGTYQDNSPALTVDPSIWEESLNLNESKTATFTVCTNTVTTVPSVQFIPSSGNPGSWISGTSALGPLIESECQDKELTVTGASNASSGIYIGYINVSGSENASDIIVTIMQLTGANDSLGPIVTGISLSDSDILAGENFSITATGDDSTTGNSSIASCEIQMNGGSWQAMEAQDGNYNEVSEGVELSFIMNTASSNTAGIRCTDTAGNTGSIYEYEFSIMKNILFIRKTSATQTSEEQWMTFLNTYVSGLGYSWDYDDYEEADLDGDLETIELYKVVIMSEWQHPSAVENELEDYMQAGGRVIHFGGALQHGVADLGFASGNYNPTTERRIYVHEDLAHYVTSGFSYGSIQVLSSNDQMYRGANGDFISGRASGQGYYFISLSSGQTGYQHETIGSEALRGSGGYWCWGVTRPDKLNSNGRTFVTRIIDWSIQQSQIE